MKNFHFLSKLWITLVFNPKKQTIIIDDAQSHEIFWTNDVWKFNNVFFDKCFLQVILERLEEIARQNVFLEIAFGVIFCFLLFVHQVKRQQDLKTCQ